MEKQDFAVNFEYSVLCDELSNEQTFENVYLVLLVLTQLLQSLQPRIADLHTHQSCYARCSVLQCIAVRCSVLQCAAMRCGVLRCAAVCIAVYCSVLQCAAVCCSVLQCVAVCCSVLQCVAVISDLFLLKLSISLVFIVVFFCFILCCVLRHQHLECKKEEVTCH